MVERVLAVRVVQLVLDQRGAVLLAQRGDFAAAGQDDEVFVAGELAHGFEEEARLDGPAAVADDDGQRGVVFDGVSVDEPVKVVVVDDLDVDGDVLVEEEALDDVGHDGRAAHAVEDDPLELSGLDSAA